jgi:polyketide synthase 12
MAAVQLARHIGAEVFATASPGKWNTLRELGIDGEHLASSRDLDFREKFLTATDGCGVDVVLNALAGDFVDASLELLPRGGRFVEMGKADLRDGETVASTHAGVSYHPFDLHEAGLDRLNEILHELVDLFASKKLRPGPITTWDVRRGIDAFRYLRDGRNVGKVVLTIPQKLDPNGTVLITGGTGALGALVARHLVATHDVRHLRLVSRRGPEADGAKGLQTELASAGCDAEIIACDVSDRAQVKGVIAAIPKEHPLTAVIHAAGVLDDGVIETLDVEQIERVLRPKVDAALHLHDLTKHLDLSQFVLFSSGAAALGSPGQGNYAAANAFLDALAQRCQTQGLAAQSLAWGLWLQDAGAGMGGGLDNAARARLGRLGIVPLSDDEGLQLLDAAQEIDRAAVVPVHLDHAALRTLASAGVLPPLLRQLVRAPVRRKPTGGRSLVRRLASLPESDWNEVVLETVRSEVAAVLGYDSPEAIDTQVAFKDLGFDSLAAVELYNRLCQATGLRLPTTLGFDYPTPEAVAEFLCIKMEGGQSPDGHQTQAESIEVG